MHSVLMLINAFLDYMDVFDFATVYNAKDEESAAQVSLILNRDISTYTLVIVLSTYPNLTNLRILDTYLRMVVPTGMFIQYVFGFNKKILDIYKYEDFVILYYTKEEQMDSEDSNKYQTISMVKGSGDTHTYTGDLSQASDFIKNRVNQDVNDLPHSVGISGVQNMEGKVDEQ